jgi:hypothetical protein
MRHGVDGDTQIEIRGDDVGEVPDDDSEDMPAMKRMSWLVRCQRRRVSYVACQGRRNSRPGTLTEAGEPAEYHGASESAVMSGVEEAAGAKSMPLSE